MELEEFGLRLSKLRMQKNVSARDMSLSIGQNPAYINNIENGKAFPSMQVFFYICEYLQITPAEFFQTDVENPEKLREVIDNLKKLSEPQLDTLAALINGLIK